MARQLPAGNDALTENLLRSDTQITCRYKAGTTDNAAKSIPFGLMQTSPIAVCSSGADSSSKVATVSNYPDFTLDNGKEVVVYFAEGNTAANPSMNVNGTGAIPLDSGYWNAGSFVKLKYVDITVSGTRIQKYLVDAGAYNTTTQLNGALTNYATKNDLSNLKVLSTNYIGSLFFQTAVIPTDLDHSLSGYISAAMTVEGVRRVFPNYDPETMEVTYVPSSVRPLSTWESMPAYVYVNADKSAWVLNNRGTEADSYEIQLSLYMYTK